MTILATNTKPSTGILSDRQEPAWLLPLMTLFTWLSHYGCIATAKVSGAPLARLDLGSYLISPRHLSSI
ncbi:hypothetical protein Dret_1509 [Desulfohalobium retbaense DSM 5692]|uniref:Uncharacterized protein n=1 Tax=Desulfohalobium retbaense (strain ATCC 49708 / DSM 5692 / JCM 16813 / HR100) TaxID=485915 RepID=C8X2Z8_DESRD|nr:hypothetical protein Dret_1509 [Desulfohalobium retbaense DSM 5692]